VLQCVSLCVREHLISPWVLRDRVPSDISLILAHSRHVISLGADKFDTKRTNHTGRDDRATSEQVLIYCATVLGFTQALMLLSFLVPASFYHFNMNSNILDCFALDVSR